MIMEVTVTTEVFSDYEGQSVEQEIILQAARMLVNQLSSEVSNEIRKIVREQVRDQVADVVAEVIENPIQLTNYLGEPTGKTQTLRQLVIAQGQEFFTQITTRDGRKEYNRDRKWGYLPRAEHVVHDIVFAEFDRMFKSELDIAVKTVRDNMDEHLAALTQRAVKELLNMDD
jgi:hypothetical protein